MMVTSGGYQRTNAGVIAGSIKNLASKGLIELPLARKADATSTVN
jgi:hypothetical protein